MSKSCCFAFVLAAICLSLEADAHLTVDKPKSWRSAAVEVRIVPQENGKGKKEMEGCGETNGTRLEDVAKEIKDEIGDVKKLITAGCGETNETRLEDVVKEIKDVKKLLTSNPTDCVTAEPSRQALVSALVSSCIPLLIQQNIDGSDFFNRSWAEFKVGFNESSGNYWLGNDLLSQLTMNHRYKLKFDLQSHNNTNHWYWAVYSRFRVLSEADNYRLQVSGYSGNAAYDALGRHNDAMFTTYDSDNDGWGGGNCAVYRGGGFWYTSCGYCRVNAARSGGSFIWYGLPGGQNLQSTRMWLQCQY